MAACANIEFEIDKVSKTNSDSSSYHNVTYSKNNQNDLPKNSSFKLDPNWDKKKSLALLFRERITVYTILEHHLYR